MDFKETGIIRRIDDLGRVVIPKEIRRKYNIQVGDPLEIGCADGCVMFRPYHQHLFRQNRYVMTMHKMFQQCCTQQDIKADLTILDCDGRVIRHYLGGTGYRDETPDTRPAQAFMASDKDYEITEQDGQKVIRVRFVGHNQVSEHDLNLCAVATLHSGDESTALAVLRTIGAGYKVFIQELNGEMP